VTRVRIETFPEASVPLSRRLQVVALQDRAWPAERPSGPEPWHDPVLEPISMLLVTDEGRVVAALDILSSSFEHAGETWRAKGLSAVVTDAAERGRGYGTRLVSAARERVSAAGADLGIFTCDAYLQAFYEGAGWESLPGTVVIGGTREDPFPSDALGKVTLGTFCSERAQVRRAAFVGARIELYPGLIDRLW
jgi:aminoglycoside 2'-N-acetyltransferase I